MSDRTSRPYRQQHSTSGRTKPADSDVLSNVSVLIPSNNLSDVVTLDSVPDHVETCVITKGNRSEARNIGAKRTSGDILVFMDDDIRFEEQFLQRQANRVVSGRIVGLEDYGLGYLITRFMAMHRETFNDVGGFDANLNHMEDTEFCIRAMKAGCRLVDLHQGKVVHIPHYNDITTRDRLKSLLYLTQKHPKQSVSVWRNVLK